MSLLRLFAFFLISAFAAGPSSAQPSSIPVLSGLRPVAGAPYLNFSAFVEGTPEWKQVYTGLEREFADRRQANRPLAQRYLLAGRVEEYFRKPRGEPRQQYLASLPADVQAHIRMVEPRISLSSAQSMGARLESDIAGQEAAEAMRAFAEVNNVVTDAYRARENELLNPKEPALRAQLAGFARARGLSAIPILVGRLPDAARLARMVDVTADFLAWRDAQQD